MCDRDELPGPAPTTPEQAQIDAPVSRRSLMRRLGRFAGEVMAPAAAVASVTAVAGTSRRAKADPVDVPADVDPGALVAKLVSRITFGQTQAELTLANTLGYDGYLEYHLNHTAIPENPAVPARLAVLPSINATGQQLFDTVAFPSQTVMGNELIEATIFRAAFSTRQLHERMVEFWNDHFNVDLADDNRPPLKSLDDRTVRALALTSFPQLLRASAMSPVMLAYLDNDASSNGNINENYARELIELHTVGADYFYAFPAVQTQATIVAVARCLTGWGWYGPTYNDTTVGGTGTTLRGQFYYNNTTSRNIVRVGTTNVGGARAGVHDTGSKTLGTVFGSTVIPARTNAAGMQDGLDVLSILETHPATAAYIAKKLCLRFLGEGVPQSIIDLVRDEYLNASNPQGIGDVKAMLRVMLRPNHVAAAFPRLKRPFHLAVSMLRVAPVTWTNSTGIRQQLLRAGHQPFNWGPPDGYPDTTQYWSGQMLQRWNIGASLVTNTSGNAGGISGLVLDDATFFSGATSAQQVMDRIDQQLFFGAMPPGEKSGIQASLPATPSASQRRDALGLAFASPAFQWY